MINKIIHTSTLAVIICIAVYGIVDAQQVYCNATGNTCIPTSNWTPISYTSGLFCPPSHQGHSQQRSNLISKRSLPDLSAGNTCCEADRCNRSNQVKYLNISIIRQFYPLQKYLSAIQRGNHTQPILKQCSLPTSPKAIPIYIMKQAIIC